MELVDPDTLVLVGTCLSYLVHEQLRYLSFDLNQTRSRRGSGISKDGVPCDIGRGPRLCFCQLNAHRCAEHTDTA